MSSTNTTSQERMVIEGQQLSGLLDALGKGGYAIAGPTIRDNAIVYDTITSVSDLPAGWVDHQDAGKYRLSQTKQKAYFGYTVGPHTWRKFLHRPIKQLLTVSREGHRFAVESDQAPTVKQALFGVRSCELHAIAIQDKVLIAGEYIDSLYKRLRENLFIVAVNCTQPGGTCFCTSMHTGPRAVGGFDIALTEVIEGKRHYFVAEAGSKAGKKMLAEVSTTAASEAECKAADVAVEKASKSMGRSVELEGLNERLYQRYDDIRWERIAERCLTCGNCTMVCPTCFCTNVEDSTDLTGSQAYRTRRWDSCFTVDYSYIHGGSIRATETSRYRQWMMHKLSYWVEQFGTYGCVGCGRCITWCPVGIDITEEAGIIAGKK